MATTLLTSILMSNKDLIISLATIGIEKFVEFFQVQKLSGICLCRESIEFLCKNLLNSKDVHLIDIKTLIFDELDSDEKEKRGLSSDLIVFPKCKRMIEDLKNILQTKSIIVLCEDRILLKYLKCRNILYMLPTDLMMQEIKANNELFDDVLFQKFKNTIITEKKDKMLLYHNHMELEQMIMSRFAGLVVKI